MCTCSNTNISENSAFMEWKVILQGRTSAVVLSVAYHWFQFWYSLFFVSAYFFRSVELNDHPVNLGKTTVCRLCSLQYMYFKLSVFHCVFQRSILVLIVPGLDNCCYGCIICTLRLLTHRRKYPDVNFLDR